MKTDAQLKDDVIEELRWDPQISDADVIGVGVKDGAVILSGQAPSYAEKMAAAQAAERVNGVKAVANDLNVKLPGATRGDVDITEAIAHVLEWNVQVPEDRVHATVEHGWVTLEGDVDHDYQRREVERMVRHVRGVIGLLNNITVRPPAPDRPVLRAGRDWRGAMSTKPTSDRGHQALATGSWPGSAVTGRLAQDRTAVPVGIPQLHRDRSGEAAVSR